MLDRKEMDNFVNISENLLKQISEVNSSIVFLGTSGAGKSSLINFLLKQGMISKKDYKNRIKSMTPGPQVRIFVEFSFRN